MPESSAPAGPQPSDLAADLAASWDAQESASSQSAPSPSAASEAAPTAPSSSSSSTASPAGPAAAADPTKPDARARDAAGKFVKQEGQPAPAAKPTDGKPAPEFKIPEKWPAEVKQRLEALHKASPEHAQFLLEQFNLVRSQQGLVEQQRQKFQPLAKTLESVEALLAPGRQQRALQNIDDATYIRNLVAAGEVLDKNPAEGLRWLAQRYGIDLQKLANPQASGEPETAPAIRQVMERQARIEQFLQSQVGHAQQERLQQASDWISRFASQADAQGQPLYPHFDDVLPEIIVNVQYQRDSGQPIDVKAAYDRAVRMNDTVWLKVEHARSEAARKAAAEKQAKDIEEAKRAGFSVSGSGGASSTQPAESIRGELERLWESTHS